MVTTRNINAVYGNRAINISQCQQLFQKFRDRKYSLEDEPRPGRSVELDENVLQAQVEQNTIVIIEELAEKLRFDQRVTEKDELVLYKNVKRRRQWVKNRETQVSQTKEGFNSRKVLLTVWWDMKGLVQFEPLYLNKTITKEIYCEQLERRYTKEIVSKQRYNPNDELNAAFIAALGKISPVMLQEMSQENIVLHSIMQLR
ncbi:histone-lysine N-methyltransferase SETMAR-like [Octopus bimaculoides]|uniref:histone-lysine N-methyltransferase SETMAR-like n=1 Tax=Octopus bimaculoides TaxID=37653 RepID=UPI00071DD381|nr:histone-lysine N-methyltransferase SETMAR-like [Octopus bimaculoides]|eukprot:XP_014776864.1 PREDICTED: histone-lysine N-methyltransferase SETMAR-like [Octopus bimaculoides]